MLKDKAELLFTECDELVDRCIKETINIREIKHITSDDFEILSKTIKVYGELKEQYIEILNILDKIERIDEKMDKVLKRLEAERS